MGDGNRVESLLESWSVGWSGIGGEPIRAKRNAGICSSRRICFVCSVAITPSVADTLASTFTKTLTFLWSANALIPKLRDGIRWTDTVPVAPTLGVTLTFRAERQYAVQRNDLIEKRAMSLRVSPGVKDPPPAPLCWGKVNDA